MIFISKFHTLNLNVNDNKSLLRQRLKDVHEPKKEGLSERPPFTGHPSILVTATLLSYYGNQ